MTSKMGNAFLQSTKKERLFDGKARKFYVEICRTLPFIHRIMKLDEVVDIKELRAVVKEKFQQYKHVQDPRVSGRLG